MTVRELITFLVNNCGLDDTIRYAPENAIENINDAAGENADIFFVDGIENRDGYVWLYEEIGRRTQKDAITMLEDIDGYVSKDSLYRLLSNYRIEHFLDDYEENVLKGIATAIKDMPNEKE